MLFLTIFEKRQTFFSPYPTDTQKKHKKIKAQQKKSRSGKKNPLKKQ